MREENVDPSDTTEEDLCATDQNRNRKKDRKSDAKMKNKRNASGNYFQTTPSDKTDSRMVTYDNHHEKNL